MVYTPSPGFIRNPGPSDNRIPDPSSIEIRPPILNINIRNPHVAIRSFINPMAIRSQFLFIFIEFRGKIGPGDALSIEGVSGLIPLGKIIIA
jgi:hypothetical protein